MLLRWLLTFAVVCGMLLGPPAMAAGCSHPQAAEQAGHHCAKAGDASQHSPAKHAPCMGACWVIEAAIPRFTAPAVSLRAAGPIPTAMSLDGVLHERDTPPPRLS